MTQLVRSRAKDTVQTAHCAMYGKLFLIKVIVIGKDKTAVLKICFLICENVGPFDTNKKFYLCLSTIFHSEPWYIMVFHTFIPDKLAVIKCWEKKTQQQKVVTLLVKCFLLRSLVQNSFLQTFKMLREKKTATARKVVTLRVNYFLEEGWR